LLIAFGGLLVSFACGCAAEAQGGADEQSVSAAPDERAASTSEESASASEESAVVRVRPSYNMPGYVYRRPIRRMPDYQSSALDTPVQSAAGYDPHPMRTLTYQMP
jgi:hypothetical protein